MPAPICSVASGRILTSGRRERTDTQKLRAGAKGSEEGEHPRPQRGGGSDTRAVVSLPGSRPRTLTPTTPVAAAVYMRLQLPGRTTCFKNCETQVRGHIPVQIHVMCVSVFADSTYLYECMCVTEFVKTLANVWDIKLKRSHKARRIT